MKIRNSVLLAGVLAWAAPAPAVDFGVMETADPIRFGHAKFIAYPLAARRVASQGQNTGAVVGVGYGFAERWDVEGQFAAYDDVTFVGSDVEYTFLDIPHVDASISGGTHFADSDFGRQWGVDLTHIGSYTPPGAPRLMLNGAVDLSYERLDLRAGQGGMDDRYFTAYFVPGAQYRVSRNIDVIGEIGIGLNGESKGYAGAGLSLYFR